MERRAHSEPGYDCRRECLHEKKGDHGIACFTWWFAVVEGLQAVSLSVLSGQYPESVDASSLPALLREVQGGCWAVHHADPKGGVCEYVAGGKCQGNTSFLAGEAFWEQHGASELGLEQPESFWQALEAELRREIGS